MRTIIAGTCWNYNLDLRMHADIFDEHSRPGLPAMPQVAEKMPHRGLVDQFEARQWTTPAPGNLQSGAWRS